MRPLPSVKRIGRPDVVRMIEKLMDLKWILLLGFIIRISISPFFADSNDFPYWASIASDVSRGEGIYSGYALWYPPVWGYAISLMTPILDLFDCIPLMELSQDVIPDNNLIGEGWLVSVGAVVILKLPLMACDVVNGLLIYVIVKHLSSDEKKALRASALWMLCPLTIWVSAGQGQFETVCLMFLLLSILFLIRGSNLLCGACVAASTLAKITPSLVVFPMLALVFVRASDRRDSMKRSGCFLLGGMLMSLLIVLPQLINGEIEFVTSFLGIRVLGHNPVPWGFDGTVMSFDPLEFLTPSGSNVSAYSTLSFMVSLILAAYIFGKKGFDDAQAVCAVAIAMSSLLMWPFAPGYTQYYIPVVGMLILCTSVDGVFEKIAWGLTAVCMVSMLAGFTHAYPLLEFGIDANALISFYDSMKSILRYPEIASTSLKFVLVLAGMYFALKMIRGEADG